jgi:hypothetical protein
VITKIVIIAVMVLIAAALGSGLYFLVHDTTNSKRTVKALTVRIAVSLILFIFLFIAFKLGFIQPHNL